MSLISFLQLLAVSALPEALPHITYLECRCNSACLSRIVTLQCLPDPDLHPDILVLPVRMPFQSCQTMCLRPWFVCPLLAELVGLCLHHVPILILLSDHACISV